MAHTTLIDEQGEPWLAGAPELRRRLGTVPVGADLSDHAVQEHGFVMMRERPGSLQVSLRPERVRRPTLATLFYRLAEVRPQRLVLSYLGRDWQHEVVGNAHEAMLRVEDLVASSAGWHPGAGYTVQRHSLVMRRHPSLQELAPLLAVWHLAAGRSPCPLPEVLGRLGFLNRSVIVRNPARSGRMVFEHRGKSFTFYQPCWNLLAMGRDVEDQPDLDYGKHTARCYREAFAEDAPRFESIDAVIRTPGREVRRSRFDRLILPWRMPNGERAATGVSLLRASYVLDCA